MENIRTLQATNGTETRELDVLRKTDGTYWLHDCTADPYADSLQQLTDDSDTAVQDVLADGFELTDLDD